MGLLGSAHYLCAIHSLHMMYVLQARRHTTEVNFEQLRGRALSELEKDTITSLSTENLSGEGYNDDSVHSGKDLLYCNSQRNPRETLILTGGRGHSKV